VAVGMLHATYLLTCWSAFPKQIWSWRLAAQEPSVFSMQCSMVKLCTGLGFRILLIPGGFFLFLLPSVAPDSQEVFDPRSSCFLLPPSSRHLLFQELVLIHLEIGAVNIIFKFISIFIYQCF
jgi:hypothetical protein